MLRFLYFLVLTYGINAYSITNTPEELRDSLIKITKNFEDQESHSIVFSSTYLIITNQFIEAIENDFFKDPEIVKKIIVNFGNRYLTHLKTSRSLLPSSWRISFQTDEDKKTKLSAKLLLAMNAHINYDLPFSLQKNLKTLKSWIIFRNDYFKMNKIFKKAIPLLVENLKNLYDRNSLNMHNLKNKIIFKMTKQWRRKAWKNGFKLYSYKKPEYIKNLIENESLTKANLILRFKNFFPKY